MSRVVRMRALAALLSAFLVVRLVSAADEAAPPREKVRVTYSAPSGCPESAAFLTEVRARVGGDWEAAPHELARTIDVTISRRDDRSVRPQGGDRKLERHLARIEFVDSQGHRITRAVSGQRCDEVMKGIALITALAIQSRVEEALSESEPVEAPTEPSPPREEKPAAPAAAAPPPAPQRAAREPADDALFIDVGARLSLAGGVGPEVALGPGGFIAFGKGQALLQLGLDALFTGEVDAAGGHAEFQLIAGRVELCPFELVRQDSVVLRPCAFGEGGVLRGKGVEDPPRVARAIPQRAAWVAPGLALRVEVELSPLVVALEGSARVPLTQPTFFFDNPKQTVHTVWPVVPGAAASVGLRFR